MPENGSEKGGKQVKKILLQAGSLSGVELEALAFAWDVGVKTTVLENALYEVEIEQAIAVCSQCHGKYQADFLYDPCPNCGHFGCTYTAGRDFKIMSITIV